MKKKSKVWRLLNSGNRLLPGDYVLTGDRWKRVSCYSWGRRVGELRRPRVVKRELRARGDVHHTGNARTTVYVFADTYCGHFVPYVPSPEQNAENFRKVFGKTEVSIRREDYLIESLVLAGFDVNITWSH